jgi:hypothetical protein
MIGRILNINEEIEFVVFLYDREIKLSIPKSHAVNINSEDLIGRSVGLFLDESGEPTLYLLDNQSYPTIQYEQSMRFMEE